MNNKYKIIAETAFSHEGNIDYLINSIDAAVEAKVDIIKFQVLLDKTGYCCEKHPSFKELDKWCFTEKQWLRVFKKAKKAGLSVLVLPLTVNSAKFCRTSAINLIDAYEVHSVCFNDVPLLESLRGTSLPVILGVGGRLPFEIVFVQNLLQVEEEQLVLMYGFQSFPTDRKNLNLNKISKLSALFNTILGFADHSQYDDILFHELNLIAYQKGCRWFEKHLVLNPGEKRTDFDSGIGVATFLEMRKRLDSLVCTLGNGDLFSLNTEEEKYMKREKQIVFTSDLSKDHILTKQDISYKIASTKSDFRQSSYPDLLGRTLVKNVTKEQPIRYGDLK